MNLSSIFLLILIAMSLAVAVALPEAQAQRKRRGTSKEIGLQLGTAWYVGDLNPGQPVSVDQPRDPRGVSTATTSTRVVFPGQYLQGRVEVWDADHPNGWQQNRDLGLPEPGQRVSVPRRSISGPCRRQPQATLVPFLFAGVACTRTIPRGAGSNGNWQPLRDGDEGQGWFEGINYLTWGCSRAVWTGVEGDIGVDHDLPGRMGRPQDVDRLLR